jgi:hypothetical protein
MRTYFEMGNHQFREPTTLAAGSVFPMFGAHTPEASAYGSHLETRSETEPVGSGYRTAGLSL